MKGSEKLNQCPVCSSSLLTGFLNVKDYTVSKENFNIDKCNSCGFQFTNPRPDQENIGKYYQSAEYISHHDESTNLLSKVYNLVRNYTTQEKINLINRYTQNSNTTLLDIGCGAGFFLQQCKKNNWEIRGTEPDPDARTVASRRTGTHISESIESNDIQNEKFDIITMWHVLEHVHKLNETIDWLLNHLNNDGTLFIAVPNNASHDAQKFDNKWAAYDVPRHLYHFTKETMQQLLEKHGFQVQEILPMWFDAFYVSMLSNQYKNNSKNIPDSIITGIISNWKGRKSIDKNFNTSSLIYVVKKKSHL